MTAVQPSTDREHCWGQATDYRVTATLPECPAWCEIAPEKHEAEAWSRHASWFAHSRRVTVGDFASIYVASVQMFAEQIKAGEEAQAADDLTPRVWLEQTDLGDGMTVAQVRELAAALEEVASQVS